MKKSIDKKGIALLLGGIGVTTLGVVMAKKASLKCAQIVKEHENAVAMIEDCAERCTEEEYSEADRISDTAINNAQTGIKLIKLYAIPGLSIVAGGCMVLKGTKHIIRMRQIEKMAELYL